MLEAGIPVVYAYIADAHDNRKGLGRLYMNSVRAIPSDAGP